MFPTTNIDPRPKEIQEFHRLTKGGADGFRKWAKENVIFDIDKQLAGAKGKAKQRAREINHAVETGQPFLLYKDPKRFCFIHPRYKSVVTIFSNNTHTVELLNERQFKNRVKLCYIFYPEFGLPNNELTLSALKMITAIAGSST